MSDYERCAKCNHAEIRAVGVDCPICFQQQRDRMLYADNAYLRQKVSEGIRARQKPSHMYRTYTGKVADANDYQRKNSLLYDQKSFPSLRKSVLSDRISSPQHFASHRMKPLKEAGAISLQPIDAVVSRVAAKDSDEEEVFFDDAPVCESNYVFVNGEVHQGTAPMPENRVMYGVDTSSAAVHAAVRAAVKKSASGKSQLSEDECAVDGPTAHQERSASRARREQSKGRQYSREVSPVTYRELYSASGRCYCVIELKKSMASAGTAKASAEAAGGLKDKYGQTPRQSESRKQRKDAGSEGERSAAPHKPTKPRDTRSQGEKDSRKCSKKRRSPSLYDRDDHSPGSLDKERGKSRERLPWIAKEHRHTSKSSSPKRTFDHDDAKSRRFKLDEVKSSATEGKCRHVDSDDSDVVLPSYSVSPREDEYSTLHEGSRGRHVSDCVVVETSPRPTHRPRRKPAGKVRPGRAPPSYRSVSPGSGEISGEERHSKHHRHNDSSESSSEWSDTSEESSWSFVLDDASVSRTNSVSATSSSSSSSYDEGQFVESRNRRSSRPQERHRKHEEHRAFIAGASSTISGYDEKSGQHHRRAKQRGDRKLMQKDARRKKTQRSSQSSHRQPSGLRSASTTIPIPLSNSGAQQPHQSRPVSPPRLPLVCAVLPPNPTGVLQPLKEEMLPSTRYDVACPSPLAHVPQASSTQNGLAPLVVPPVKEVVHREEGKRVDAAVECLSPALGPMRAEEDAAAAANPMRRGFGEMPSEPLQLTHFMDLRPPSASSSGPLCSPSQGTLGVAAGRNGRSTCAVPAGGPVDLNFITEHVLRVIRERLSGGGGVAANTTDSRVQKQRGGDEEAAAAAAAVRASIQAAEEAEELHLENERATEAQRRRAELAQLRKLLRDTKQEMRLFQQEQVPLDDLSASLKFAFAKVSRVLEDKSVPLGGGEEATDSNECLSTVNTESGTLIYADGEKRYLESLNEGPTSAAAAGLPNLGVDMVTLERLLKVLPLCRGQHAIHLRELQAEEERKAKEAQKAKNAKEAAERQRKAKEEQEERCRQAIAALHAQESAGRAATRAEAKTAFDQLLAKATKSEEASRERAFAAQAAGFEDQRVDLAEDELDARAALVAMEETEAVEDLWDVASRLWQAATSEAEENERERQEAAAAEEAARVKSAAWQAAQAEVQQKESAARQRALGKGKPVRLNLTPNKLYDSSETGGKELHVEARARERRRADRLRQESLTSASSRPSTNKSERSSAAEDRRVLPHQPSTIRVNVAGSDVKPTPKGASRWASRASPRRPAPPSRSQNSAGNGRLGARARSRIPPSRGGLQSRSDFEMQGDLDLQVNGRPVGVPANTRSRTSSLASAGLPVMGGIFHSATPHKNLIGDVDAGGPAGLGLTGAE